MIYLVDNTEYCKYCGGMLKYNEKGWVAFKKFHSAYYCTKCDKFHGNINDWPKGVYLKDVEEL